jgi:hypothetical protein
MFGLRCQRQLIGRADGQLFLLGMCRQHQLILAAALLWVLHPLRRRIWKGVKTCFLAEDQKKTGEKIFVEPT